MDSFLPIINSNGGYTVIEYEYNKFIMHILENNYIDAILILNENIHNYRTSHMYKKWIFCFRKSSFDNTCMDPIKKCIIEYLQQNSIDLRQLINNNHMSNHMSKYRKYLKYKRKYMQFKHRNY
jgi:hypothetical protein